VRRKGRRHTSKERREGREEKRRRRREEKRREEKKERRISLTHSAFPSSLSFPISFLSSAPFLSLWGFSRMASTEGDGDDVLQRWREAMRHVMERDSLRRLDLFNQIDRNHDGNVRETERERDRGDACVRMCNKTMAIGLRR
jgi:hypothetical protein